MPLQEYWVTSGFEFAAFADPALASSVQGLQGCSCRAPLDLRQREAYRSCSCLDPLPDESAPSQFRVLCFRQSSARLGHALARATGQRFLATQSLPLLRPPPPPNAQSARNLPGSADFVLRTLPSPLNEASH